jgi:hypothetical protein
MRARQSSDDQQGLFFAGCIEALRRSRHDTI